MTLSTTSDDCSVSSYGDLRCTLEYATAIAPVRLTWDFLADAATWGADTGSDPYTKTLPGVMWSHTEGELTSCIFMGGCDAEDYEERLPSHYWSGLIQMEPREPDPGWDGIEPIFPSFFPPPACIACGASPRLPWFVADPCLRAGECGLEEARVRFPGFDRPGDDLTDAVQLLATTERWLLASDLLGDPSESHPVLVGISSDGKEMMGALIRDGNGILTNAAEALDTMMPIATGGAAAPVPFASFGASYRASDMVVLLLGVPQGQESPVAELWRLDIVSGQFSQLPLRLPDEGVLGTVYAVGVRQQDPHLYALAEVVGEAVSLVRIPLDGAEAEVLEQVAERGSESYAEHALMFDAMGDVLLAGYGASGYSVVHAPLSDLDTPDAIAADDAPLLAAPFYDGSGVSFAVDDPEVGLVAGGLHEGGMDRGGQYSLSDAF